MRIARPRSRVLSRAEQDRSEYPPRVKAAVLNFLNVTNLVTIQKMRRVSLYWQGYFPAFMCLAVGVLEVSKVYWLWSWWLRWALLLFGLSVMAAFQIGRKVHWSVGLLTASTLISAVWGFHWFGNGAPSPVVLTAVPPKAELVTAGPELVDTIVRTLAIGQHGAIAAFTFLVLVFTFSELSKATLQRVLWAFGILGHLNSFVTLYQVSQNSAAPMSWTGIVGNPSLSMCFSAVTLPLLCSRWWVAVPTLACVAFTQTSMGVGTLAVVLSVWAASYFKQWIYALPLMGFFLLAGALTQGEAFLNSSGRYDTWRMALDWFSAQDSWFLGIGLGQWATFIPQAQKIAGVNPNQLFTFGHSDPLQQLVECGLLGLSAAVICAGHVTYRLRKSPRLLASFIGMLACSFGNFPLRMALTAALCATLAAVAFTQRSSESPASIQSGRRRRDP